MCSNFPNFSIFFGENRNSRMHDFCFTIPYGLLLVCGGVIGYAKKGSTASLAGGVGTGSLLVLAGYLSLQAFHKRKNSYFALILETGMTPWTCGRLRMYLILFDLGIVFIFVRLSYLIDYLLIWICTKNDCLACLSPEVGVFGGKKKILISMLMP